MIDDKHLQRILLVDDDEEILATCLRCLNTSGFKDVLTLSDSRKVMDLLARKDASRPSPRSRNT